MSEQTLFDARDFKKMMFVYYNSDLFEATECIDKLHRFKKYSLADIEKEFERLEKIKGSEKVKYLLTVYVDDDEVTFEFEDKQKAWEKLFDLRNEFDANFNILKLGLVFNRLKYLQNGLEQFVKADDKNIFVGIKKDY